MNELNRLTNQIQEIDALLAQEDLLQNFVCQLENSDSELPLGDTLAKVRLKMTTKQKLKQKYDFISILKVACFVLLSITIWEFGIVRLTPNFSMEQRPKKSYEFINNFNRDFKDFSNNFINFNFKKGE